MDPQVAQVIRRYWSDNDALTALAIALQESGGDPSARSKSGRYRGLWQLSQDHPVNPLDLEASTRYAYGLWKRYGWRPWGSFNSGEYRKHLDRARQILTA